MIQAIFQRFFIFSSSHSRTDELILWLSAALQRIIALQRQY